MTTETEIVNNTYGDSVVDAIQPERKRPGRKTNAERAAMQANATSESTDLTTTATEAEMAVPDEPAVTLTPLEAIQAAMDSVPESEVGTWLIDILCKATLATQFKPVFRAAAEFPDGEARVYRVLQVMTRTCSHMHHNQLRMAAAQSIAAARTNGRGIRLAPNETLSASEMANKVSYAAKNNCRLQDLAAYAGPLPVERE